MITVILAELLRRLSENLILPFNAMTYSQVLENEFDRFKIEYVTELADLGVDLNQMKLAIGNFTKSANEFHQRLDVIDRKK